MRSRTLGILIAAVLGLAALAVWLDRSDLFALVLAVLILCPFLFMVWRLLQGLVLAFCSAPRAIAEAPGARTGFNTPWQRLPPGWRWVLWGLGGLLLGTPLLARAFDNGFPSSVMEMVRSLALGIPLLMLYVLVAFSSRRSMVLGVYAVLLVLGGFLLPAVGHR